MSTETSTQDEAKKIWEQLDSEAISGKDDSDAVAAIEDAESETAKPAATDAKQDQVEVEDPAVLRNKLAGMEAIVQQLSTRLRNAEGHIGGLSSQLKSQLEAAKAVAAAGGDAPSAREIQNAQGDPKALDALAEEYPDIAKYLRPAIENSIAGRFAEFEKRIPKNEPAPQGFDRRELETFKAEMRVESRHPGWQETVKGAEFTGWLQQSPRELKLLAASDEPADAIRLLDMFSELKSSTSGQKTQRLSSAAAMPTGNRTPVRTKNVDDMTPQEFWRYQDQLDKQKA